MQDRIEYMTDDQYCWIGSITGFFLEVIEPAYQKLDTFGLGHIWLKPGMQDRIEYMIDDQ